MPQIIPESIKQAVMGDPNGAKVTQLAAHTVEPTRDTRITTDFGTKQSNTDNWLRVNSNDQIGPMLLEDHFSREKVNKSLSLAISDTNTERYRFIASIMKESLKELSMLEELVLSALSSCSIQLQMSLMPVF